MNAQANMGIIMLDTQFPRVPGDAGRPETWDFPVVYKVVRGITPQRFKENHDKKLLKAFQKAAQELEREGAVAITSTCGFLSIYQQEIARTVKIPVLLSSLLQIALAHRILRKDQKVGIITVDSNLLGADHLKAIGADSIPIAIKGLESGQELNCVLLENKKELDLVRAEQDMVATARRLVDENPAIGAIVLECANMAPYAKAVQEAVKLPIFDITTLVNYIYQTIFRERFF